MKHSTFCEVCRLIAEWREADQVRYRKKPVVIEAVQWTGKNYDEVEEFMHHSPTQAFGILGPGLIILSGARPQGRLRASWLIKAIKRESLPVQAGHLRRDLRGER